MRAFLLVFLSCLCFADAARVIECTVKYNVTYGPLEELKTTCELKYVKYNQGGKQIKFANSTNLLTYQNIRVKITESNIQSIPNILFHEFRQLEILEINGVGLRNIYQNSFDGADSLKTMQAYGNKITTLSPFVFMGADKLENLDLSTNLITNIHHETFIGLERLKQISLSNNRISIIDEQTFQTLKDLEWIWLDRNQIKIIAVNLLVNNQKLEGIYAQENKISALSSVLFDKLPNLSFLFLSHNNCTSKDFVNTKIAMNSNVKKELSKCFKEFRTIVPDEEEKFRLKNVLRDAEKAIATCEADKAALLERLETSRQQLANLEYKNGK